MRKIFLICSAVITLLACNRGEDEVIQNPDAILENTVRSYSVKDLKAGERDTQEGAVYYNLLKNKEVPYAEITSDNWDLAFVAAGRLVNVYANTGGSVAMVDSEYEKLKEIPNDTKWIETKGKVGIWLEWNKYLKYTGAPTHVLIPLQGKTIVVKTGNGKYYAKLKMKSIYKGGVEEPTQKDWANMGYFTFDYTIQTTADRAIFGK